MVGTMGTGVQVVFNAVRVKEMIHAKEYCMKCGSGYYPPEEDIDPGFCSECLEKNKKVTEKETSSIEKETEKPDKKPKGYGRRQRMKKLQSLPYYKYLKTNWWKGRREMMLKRADHKCNKCGSEKNLSVHHKNYKRIGGEKSKDLIVLCNHCHKRTHKPTFEYKRMTKEYREVVKN